MKLTTKFLVALYILESVHGFVPVQRLKNAVPQTAVYLIGRLRNNEVSLCDPIEIGAPLPDCNVGVLFSHKSSSKRTNIHELLGSKGTQIIVGTDSCIPGYKTCLNDFKKLGIDKVAFATSTPSPSETPEDDSLVMFHDKKAQLARKLGLAEKTGKRELFA